MKRQKAFFIFLLVLSLISVAGCKKLVPSKFEIETSSELGPNTLDRIDDLNDTIATGVEIGPETRATIDELNKTVEEGLEFGFKEDTLQRVDVLLGMVEQGVGIKAGLDAETNRTVNNLIETLDDQPGQWENTMTEIIHTLEGSTSRVAEQMADEVEGLMVDARVNTQQLSASMGAEFRCNVDFMSTRAGDTVDQFIGRSLVGRLQGIVSGEEPEEEDEIPVPMVCQMVPDQISLEKIGDEFVFDNAVVRISGYNFVEENKPEAYVVSEEGKPVESVDLYPFLNSPYQIQVNLQDIDFSDVPTRSRVVFEWPQSGSFFAMAMVLPSEEPTPTVEVKPELTVDAAGIEVRIGPGNKYYSLGKAALGAVYEVTGHNGSQSWWQIDFDGDLGWLPDSVVTRNEVPVGAASSLPLDPPSAAFSMAPSTGKAPLDIHFLDESTGDPTFNTWYIIPEGGNASQLGGGEEITYEFASAGNYTIKLYVENEWGKDEVEKSIYIDEPDELTIVQPMFKVTLEPVLFPTATPGYTRNIIFRNYTDIPAGEPFTTDVRTDQYNCSVVSLAGLDGDIKEKKVGNVFKLWLSRTGTYWKIDANFRTHNDQEDWSIGLMCVEKSLSTFYSSIYIRPPESMTVTLDPTAYPIPENYTCSIAGFDIKNVNVEDDSAGDIIQVFTRKNEDGEWEVTADYMEEGGEENWLVQMMCFYDNQEKILDYDDSLTHLDIFDVSAGAYRTNISSSEYACGVAGMHAISGEVKEGGDGDIIRVYTYMYDGRWWVYADFRSEHQHEKWDIDLICAHRSVVGISPSQWRGEWIKR